ncbi:MAG: metal-sulfur cluster assembly factor [Sandaracinaceae bacterium]|jgi:metal-sulfur cluster biosynthetic enzyme|nr:metal-sulfur cluster assembly factor [Sandaracinaceae bacterium]
MDATEQADRARNALSEVLDPELGISIVELGLVYDVRVHEQRVEIDLTMTSAACPLSEQLMDEVESRLQALDAFDEVSVNLVWDPPWSPDRMSEAARRDLGWS